MASYSTITDVYAGGTVMWDPARGPDPVYAKKRIVYDDKEATRNPNYRAIVKGGGKLPPLPYRRSERTVRSLFGTVQRRNQWGVVYEATGVGAQWAGWHGARPPSYYPEYLDALDKADRAARNKVRLKIKDQKVNLVQAFAERQQTTSMIATAVTNLNSSYRHLRRGDLVSAGRVFGLTIGARAAKRYRAHHGRIKSKDDIDQMLSSGVLQIQYGIKPLLNDIVGSYELMLDKQTVPVTETTRSTGKCVVDLGWSQKVDSFTATRKGIVDVSVQYGVTYAAKNVLLQTAGQVGLTNPALIAWELLPWSFVIDWFIPIGNAISSVDATTGMEFLSGWRSEKVIIECQNDNTAGDEVWMIATSDGESSKSFRRTIIGEFPSAAIPSFKNPVSLDHLVNGLALLAGFKKSVYGSR